MNELAKIAEESGLPTIKANELLEIFQEFFGVTATWEEKAKKIVVTDESQTDMMLLAREGRKEMQQLRLKLDRTHKDQKQYFLLAGRAVDGMKNVLRFPIIQLEQYLQKQENFVIDKKKAEVKARQEQAMRDLEAKEAAEEKALQEKFEADRLENIRLKEEAEESERKAKIARDKAIATQKKIEEIAQEEREAHKKEIEKKQRENFEREEKIRVENEKEVAAEQKKRDIESKERAERAKLRNEAGKARQELLAEIDVHFDFETCADMKTGVWMEFYERKKKEYDSKQNEIFIEKLRVRREEKKKSDILALEKERIEKELKDKQEEKDRLEKELAEERMASDRKLTEQLEKNRVGQVRILKAKQEKASQVKCPKCSHVFIPPQKLL